MSLCSKTNSGSVSDGHNSTALLCTSKTRQFWNHSIFSPYCVDTQLSETLTFRWSYDLHKSFCIGFCLDSNYDKQNRRLIQQCTCTVYYYFAMHVQHTWLPNDHVSICLGTRSSKLSQHFSVGHAQQSKIKLYCNCLVCCVLAVDKQNRFIMSFNPLFV